MRNLFFLSFLIFWTSCVFNSSDGRNDSSDSDATTSEEQALLEQDIKAVSLEYFDTINIKGTSLVIIPVGARKAKTKRSQDYSLNLTNQDMKFGYDSYYKDYDQHFFNLIFYDVEKDSSYLFFNQERAIIKRLSPNVNESGELASKFIFYTIRDKDYNMDGMLNHKDSDHLFVSNKDGSNLTQLTPNNTQLENWTIIQESNIIIAKVLVDVNDDKIFKASKGDRLQLIKIDLIQLSKGKPFLSKETEKQLKEQFLELVKK